MKKITILLLALTMIFVGCNGASKKNNGSNAANVEEVQETNENITQVTGKLETKYIENDIKYIILEVGNLSEKLDAGNLKDFEILQDGQILTVTYDESKRIVELLDISDPEESQSNPEDSNRVISYTETFSLQGLNEYKNADLKNFPDLGIEKVTLYTDAESDGQGGFRWDDGNRFVLIAHKDNGGYLLYDERVQIGGVKVNVFSIENVLNVSMMDFGTANISFRVFKLIDGEFVENIKYQGEGNVNMIDNF